MKKICFGFTGAVLLEHSVSLADESAQQTQSVQISVEKTSTSESDGENDIKSTVSGKIVIVGPDGEKQEFDLGEKLPEGFQSIHLPGKNNAAMVFGVDTDEAKSRYMIGVTCEPASDVLRSHLNIEGKGLVVTGLSNDMPAAKAGLQEGDIVVSIGDTKISSISELVKAVGSSEGKAMKLGVIQKGKHTNLEITPVMSTDVTAIEGLPQSIRALMKDNFEEFKFDVDIDDIDKKIRGTNNRMMIRRIGPGFRISNDKDLNIIDLFNESGEAAESTEGLEALVETMKERLANMEEKLEALSKENK